MRVDYLDPPTVPMGITHAGGHRSLVGYRRSEGTLVLLFSNGELVAGADATVGVSVSFAVTSATGIFVSDVVEFCTYVGRWTGVLTSAVVLCT